MKHSPMTTRGRTLSLLAAFLLVAAASPAVAAVPPQDEVAAPAVDCLAAPMTEVDAEEALVFEIGDMTLAPTGVEQPIALSGSCEEYCMNDRSACVAACPLPFGSPENNACRADCSYDFQACMYGCW
jgi:hypothetical protein